MEVKNKCPHCSKEALPVFKKLFLGPFSTVNCQSCGKKLGISHVQNFIAALPVILMIIILVASNYNFLGYYFPIAILIAVLISTCSYIYWIPLISKEK